MATYQWTAPTGTDPVDDGGSVGQLLLRYLPGDTLVPHSTIPGPATKTSDGVYEWTLPAGLVEQRYWPVVTYDPDGTGDITAEQDGVDLPGWETTRRVVTPWDVAVAVGLTLPLTDIQRIRLSAAIDRAQAKVGDYLNRPLLPEARTFTHRQPLTGYELTDPAAWPDVKREADDTIDVTAVTVVDYSYTVDVLVGLNAATDPRLQAVRDWIIADAAGQMVAATGDARLGTREVTSVSADGQSVSYQQAGTQATGDTGVAGGKPELRALRKWRRMPVHQRVTYKTAPWPYEFTP